MITDRFCKNLCVWLLILSIFTNTKEPDYTKVIAFGPNNQTTYQDQNNQNFYSTTSQSNFPNHLPSYNDEQIRHAAICALLKAQMSKSIFQQLQQNLHMQHYGINADYLNTLLYQKSFEELESWIIKNKKLTKEQAIHIWTKYCNPKHFKWDKKNHGYQTIEEEYNQRKQNALKQQQQIKKEQDLVKQKVQEIEKHKPDQSKDAIVFSRDLKSLQEQYHLPPKYLCEGIDSKTLQQRKQALQKTIEQNYAQYEQLYYLNTQIEGYLRSHDLQPSDYTSCFGTALQQQLHTEICQLFDHIAQQEGKIMFATDAINFTDAAHDQNKKEQIATAITLADIAWTLSAIPLGICESIKDTILLPFHAPQIIKGLGQALYFVIETSAINNLAKYTNLPKAAQDRDERNALIKQGIVQVASAIANATWHERIKGATKLIADFYVPGKIFHATGHLFAGVAAQSKKLRNLENVAAMIDSDSGFAEMVEEIMETTKTLKPTTPEGLKGQMLVECMEAEAVAAQAANTVIRPLRVVIDEIKALGGAIPLHRTDLYHEFTTAMQEIMTKINKPLSKSFMTKYQNRKINNLSVNLNLKHIAQSSVNIQKYTGRGIYEIIMELSHEPGICQAFEQAGLVKITNIKKLPNGCYEYSLENIFNGKPFTKTEFPNHWDIEKIIQSAWDTYEHGAKNITDQKIVKEYFIDGLDISVVIKEKASKDLKNLNTENIITILPYKTKRIP